MTLSSGFRLGPYEILSPLGAGGMGEVYKARDTRLDRTVAVKVLPTNLSSSPESRQRFEREARTISQLSHPHICALYDVGREGETEFLVMELLEGQSLADRLAKGAALPLDQALRFGVEISDALDKAHRQGIVHRDLKPGNVMLTTSGVKILDFGLAKAFGQTSPVDALTALPTESPLTEKGTLLGTVQYMAPEQLEGKDADARTDIFALGLLLHEMATGSKAFTGATRASLIGAVLRDQPAPISRLQPVAPRALDRVVSTCLAKDPEERWQTARDVGLQLDWIRREQSSPTSGAEGFVAAAPERRSRAAILPWLVATAAVAAAVLALLTRASPKASAPVTRSFLVPPPGTTFHVYGANVGSVAVSRDGRRIAFGAREADSDPNLWIRDLDASEPFRVPGGDGALFPFWSPDGRSIGFFSRGKLKIVEGSPSPPPARELADVVEARGGSWGDDGTILFAPANADGLMRVPASGGAPSFATRVDKQAGEKSHRWPYFVPGSRRFLYEIRKSSSGPEPAAPGTKAIYLGSLDGSAKREILSEDTSAEFAPPGFLFFRRANNLMAAACDPETLAIHGDPVVVTSSIQGFAATGASIFSVSRDLLVYSPQVPAAPSQMVWLDRTGREIATVGPPGQFVQMSLSPDGRSVVAAEIEEPLPPDLWIFDSAVGRGIRLTRDALPQVNPVFGPGGRIFFSVPGKGPWDIWEISPRGVQDMKAFLESGTTKSPNDISPDGRWLLYREFNPGTRGDLKVVSLTGDRTPRPFIASSDDESNGTFSPDGLWVAYASDEAGRKEVYVASFAEPTRRFRVSTEGGAQPRWRRDGKELFYVRSGQLVAVAVERKGDELSFGESRALFPIRLERMMGPGFDTVTGYDIAPDGRILALVRRSADAQTPFVLMQNWIQSLKGPPSK